MWSAACDVCNTTYEIWNGCVALNEKSAIADDIKESGEWAVATDGKTYCTDCHQKCWNEESDQNEIFSKDTQDSGAIFLGTEEN